MYDTGYRILVNDDIGKKDNNRLAIWVNLLMVLCTGFVFSADGQSGVDRLQRATWKGRRPLVMQKVLVGTLVLTPVLSRDKAAAIRSWRGSGFLWDRCCCFICSLEMIGHFLLFHAGGQRLVVVPVLFN